MKIKCTKVFCKELNKRIKEFNILYEEVSPDYYKLYVDSDLFNNEVDYDFNKSCFKCFKIVYDCSYYAIDRYVTTKDLNKIFNRITEKTIENYIEEFKNVYMI